MNTQPLVSVLIPVYNSEAFLAECLESVLAQTLAEFEVICVDDGSTDGSGELLAVSAERDERIKVCTQSNQGVSAARNRGLDEARGSYVLFLDADDFLAPETLATLTARAEAEQAQIVTYGGTAFGGETHLSRYLTVRDAFYTDPFAALFEENGAYPLVFKLFEHCFLEEHHLRFDTQLTLGEDSAFVFAAFPHARRMSFVSGNLYHYRAAHAGSAMHEAGLDAQQRIEQHLTLIDSICSQWDSQDCICGNERRLLEWLARLLFSDTWHLARSARQGIATQLNALLETYNLSHAQTQLDPLSRYSLAFLITAPGPFGKAALLFTSGNVLALASSIAHRLRTHRNS